MTQVRGWIEICHPKIVGEWVGVIDITHLIEERDIEKHQIIPPKDRDFYRKYNTKPLIGFFGTSLIASLKVSSEVGQYKFNRQVTIYFFEVDRLYNNLYSKTGTQDRIPSDWTFVFSLMAKLATEYGERSVRLIAYCDVPEDSKQ